MSSLSLPWPFRKGAKKSQRRKEEEAVAIQLEELGVTPQLLDFTKGFTVDTFKNFPLQGYTTANGDLDASLGSNLNNDLSEWQERHAMLLLGRSKEISQIRYALCPRVLQDNQFWRIYFLLVKKYIVSYEMHAIQKTKLKNDLEKEKSWYKVGIEVEMTESKIACCSKTVLHTNGIGGEGTFWNYDGEKDSVVEVSRDEYYACRTLNPIAVHHGGDNKVSLVRSGAYYFVSGAAGSCEKGERIVVVVISQEHVRRVGFLAPAPASLEIDDGLAVALAIAGAASKGLLGVGVAMEALVLAGIMVM